MNKKTHFGYKEVDIEEKAKHVGVYSHLLLVVMMS